MKRASVYFCALCICLAAGCGTKATQDPVEAAIAAKMEENHPGLTNVKIYSLEKTGSVTLGEELDRREKLLQTKFKAENREFLKYKMEGKNRNAELHKERGLATKDALKRFEDFRNEPGFRPDSVIYSIYSFYASGRINGAKDQTDLMEASVGSDFKVYNIQPAGGNIKTGMGAAIPGYYDKIIWADIPELEEELETGMQED